MNAFTRQNVMNALDNEGQFKLTYRLMMDGKPVYVGMKAVRLPDDPSHIIVGVSNVDEQMRQKEEVSRMQTERDHIHPDQCSYPGLYLHLYN